MNFDTAQEFYEDHKHLFEEALNLRSQGKHDESNRLYYLLNMISDQCKTIDELRTKLKKCWKK